MCMQVCVPNNLANWLQELNKINKSYKVFSQSCSRVVGSPERRRLRPSLSSPSYIIINDSSYHRYEYTYRHLEHVSLTDIHLANLPNLPYSRGIGVRSGMRAPWSRIGVKDIMLGCVGDRFLYGDKVSNLNKVIIPHIDCTGNGLWYLVFGLFGFGVRDNKVFRGGVRLRDGQLTKKERKYKNK